jgi:3-phenylpropionate/cinnamic acid dioxygenase small subunit
VNVRELYDEYSYLLDEGDYDGWLDLFTEDCDYRIVARENWERGLPLATMRCDSRAMLADRLDSIRHTQFFAARTMRHFVSAVRPGAGEGVTANFLVTETLPDDPSRIHSVGQYRDEVTSSGGALRFSRKLAIYDAPLVLTSLIVPL